MPSDGGVGGDSGRGAHAADSVPFQLVVRGARTRKARLRQGEDSAGERSPELCVTSRKGDSDLGGSEGSKESFATPRELNAVFSDASEVDAHATRGQRDGVEGVGRLRPPSLKEAARLAAEAGSDPGRRQAFRADTRCLAATW